MQNYLSKYMLKVIFILFEVGDRGVFSIKIKNEKITTIE